MNILDLSPHWKKAHVGQTYYHVDTYAQRTVEIYNHRVEFWKFYPRTATNSLVSILWLDDVRDAIVRERPLMKGNVSDEDVLNEALFVACAKLSRQELERDIMPAFEPVTTLRSGITIDQHSVDYSEVYEAAKL